MSVSGIRKETTSDDVRHMIFGALIFHFQATPDFCIRELPIGLYFFSLCLDVFFYFSLAHCSEALQLERIFSFSCIFSDVFINTLLMKLMGPFLGPQLLSKKKFTYITRCITHACNSSSNSNNNQNFVV